jgi:peptide/nickel transport system substrate-binding protein
MMRLSDPLSGFDATQRAESVRGRVGEVENHLIDELRAGRIGRREFIRRGTVLGMSISTLGVIVSGCARPNVAKVSPSQTKPPKPGGTIRAGIVAPAAAIDPISISDEGGLAVLAMTGQFLVFSDRNLMLHPVIATSWKPNHDGSVWTFKIRQGVRFTDGTPMSAEDVAATFNRLADPKVGSNSLSTFAGVLSKGNTEALDAETVRFRLDAANGNFPHIVSSDNYNAIILPRNYSGNWQSTFIGTGPWKLQSFTPQVGVTFVRNPHYWGPPTVADTAELKFYAQEQAAVLGLQGNQVDVLPHFSVAGGRALLTDPSIRTTQFHSAAYREIHLRCDKEPFTDKRVRRAMALLVDRRGLVEGLLATKSDYGNDSPFAPLYPSTVKSVPQRQRDLAEAKALLAAAGKPNGFSVPVNTSNDFELPDLAQVLQDNVLSAGIRLSITASDLGTYYGSSKFGTSPWLDSVVGITDYGHRGVPNVTLDATLTSKGPWNAAHFRNPTYDKLVADYIAALDLHSQRRYARRIQTLLLDESPLIIPYFYYFLTGAHNNVSGEYSTAMGQVDVSRAGMV